MKTLSVADLFCGAGGTSQGAEDSGAGRVVFAVNHWPTAIETHSANFPHARHVCARIDQVSPAECPKIDVLLASPECCHHSRARGGRPMSDQQRAMAWDVLKWAEFHRPSWIVVENVIEWELWGPLGSDHRPLKTKRGATFEAWVRAIQSLGYTVDWRRLNAADYGAATSRTRLFVIARKGRRSVPWPEPTHGQRAGGELPGLGVKPWRAAWEIIDWSKPCPSIFARKRPLADKTLLRIEAGLRRFCSAANVEAFLVKLRGQCNGSSIHRPADTITASGKHHGVAVPFTLKYHSGQDPAKWGRVAGMDEPLGTLDTQNRYGLVTPFMLSTCGGGAPRETDQPIPTVTAHGGCWLAAPFVCGCGGREGQSPPKGIDQPINVLTAKNDKCVVVPYVVNTNHGGEPNGRHYPVDSPLGAISTHNGRALVQAFLTKYYGSADGAQDLRDPVDTITAKHRHGLAMVKLIETMAELRIVDIGFRMLDVDELARATGFREDYVLCGTKAERTRQVGNAVPPPFSEAITREIAAA